MFGDSVALEHDRLRLRAEAVAATCANRQIQLNDLNEHYGLGVKCVSATDLLAAVLVE